MVTAPTDPRGWRLALLAIHVAEQRCHQSFRERRIAEEAGVNSCALFFSRDVSSVTEEKGC